MKPTSLTKEQKKDIYLASGSAYPELAAGTAEQMGISVGETENRVFANTELYVRYVDSVRDDDVYVVQSLAATINGSVNDYLMEQMLLIDAAKRASASSITVVAPYLPYSRQDRKAKGREPISSATVIRMFQAAGADRIVSVDVHSQQLQAVFNGPFDHLTAEPLILKALEKRIQENPDNFVVVAPDAGRTKVAEHYAIRLGTDSIYMPKTRDRSDNKKIYRPESIYGVKGKTCLIIDDMIDTGGTLLSAAETLERSGAAGVIACATHGLFSEPAFERLENAPINEFMVTNTLPQNLATEALGQRVKVLKIEKLLTRALIEIASGGSVSKIFKDRNHQ